MIQVACCYCAYRLTADSQTTPTIADLLSEQDIGGETQDSHGRPIRAHAIRQSSCTVVIGVHNQEHLLTPKSQVHIVTQPVLQQYCGTCDAHIYSCSTSAKWVWLCCVTLHHI